MTIQQNRVNIGLAKILIFWVNNFLIHFNILVGNGIDDSDESWEHLPLIKSANEC